MIYNLVDPSDPILHKPIPNFDFDNTPIDPIDLVANLAETMLMQGGIGLAANQCGLSHRVFVLLTDDIIPCFNPLVVDVSEETILLEEGCLSYPGLLVKVRRPRKIKVRYTEPNKNVITATFDGITARAFLHELSHLDGIVHLNEASIIHKKQALTQWKSLKRKLKNETR